MSNEIKGKIILLGASKVGKTSLLTRYIDDKFSTIVQSTMGMLDNIKILKYKFKGIDFRTKREQCQDFVARLDIWDTAGQEKFKTINKTYYKNAIGAIIIFDLTFWKVLKKFNFI